MMTTMCEAVPAALRGKLEFGNLEQIKAVKALPEPEERADGELCYIVKVEVSGTAEVEVWATSAAEAEERAQEDFDITMDCDDMEIDSARARLKAKGE